MEPKEKAEDKLRRVLFELAIDDEGAIEWRFDRDMKPVLLFSVLGSLDIAREEILYAASRASRRGDDDE